MERSVEVAKTFEEQVFERMRASIGELMPDEQLKKLLEKAIDQMFFQPKIRKDGYGYHSHTEPAEIYSVVKELLEPTMRKAIREHLEAHHVDVMCAINAALAGGFVQAYHRALTQVMQEPFLDLQQSLARVCQANNLNTGE
jgi:hypothetical protein